MRDATGIFHRNREVLQILGGCLLRIPLITGLTGFR